MKQVEFDIELVKKIQAGEVKGIMRTAGGDTVRFLGKIKCSAYPLVFARKIRHSNGDEEVLEIYTLTGKYSVVYNEHVNDIIIEIEEPKQEYQFKPFDKVLVRDEDYELWKATFFSHYEEDTQYHYRCSGDISKQCIPYKGNEHLLGTTEKPKEE